jgi:LysM repeat protein
VDAVPPPPAPDSAVPAIIAAPPAADPSPPTVPPAARPDTATRVPAPATRTPASARTHTVRAGETLFAIARRYGVSMDALRAANPGVQGDRIQAGQTLRIPPVR